MLFILQIAWTYENMQLVFYMCFYSLSNTAFKIIYSNKNMVFLISKYIVNTVVF